ncbi:MAG TPA: proline racemase family protein [Thermomicrobiales bacterium]|nr:proline racemase family protein [Thermomicrobiales bacterium]
MRWKEMFTSIDAHVGGQPLRMITFGVPRIAPGPVRQQAAEIRDNFDYIRRWLLAEPRGHAGLTGAILLPAEDPEVDYGVVFLSARGYKPLSGHGMIALATILIDSGTVPADGPDTRINFETVAGPIQARATVDQGKVRGVRFRNVPSFRLQKDLDVSVNGTDIQVDVAYGGNWYAIAKAEDLGVSLEPDASREVANAGIAVSRAVMEQVTPEHPEDPEASGLFGTVILGDPTSEDATSRNATVYLDGLVDRSPCGTGMAATMACMAEDGQLDVSLPFVSESIVGSFLTGRLMSRTTVGEYPGIIAEIAGRGQVTGTHTFYVDPTDPLADGFVLF